MMIMITMIMMIILISQWNCSDIRDVMNQGRSYILSKGAGWESNPGCLSDCHVDIHSKSDTHFFACAVCEAGRICPHPILHWRARWREGPSILSNKIMSQTLTDEENTLIRKLELSTMVCSKKIRLAIYIFVQKERIFEINLGFG